MKRFIMGWFICVPSLVCASEIEPIIKTVEQCAAKLYNIAHNPPAVKTIADAVVPDITQLEKQILRRQRRLSQELVRITRVNPFALVAKKEVNDELVALDHCKSDIARIKKQIKDSNKDTHYRPRSRTEPTAVYERKEQ